MYNFNYDGSKLRLRIENERYLTDEERKTVTVTADVRVVVPDFITRTIDKEQLPVGFISEVNRLWSIEMTATAKCAPGDGFDEHIGKKIAMARLEAKAYTRFSKAIDNWIDRFNDFIDSLGTMYRDFTERAHNAAEHDLRYIQDLAKK